MGLPIVECVGTLKVVPCSESVGNWLCSNEWANLSGGMLLEKTEACSLGKFGSSNSVMKTLLGIFR